MKKTLFILIPALLFFSACGKKEDNSPPPSKSKHNKIANAGKKVQKKYPLKNKTVHKTKPVIPTVVITAKLTSDEKRINQESVCSKILLERYNQKPVVLTSLTNCRNNEITFPPIRERLKRLRVAVKADGYTESYSDYFDTLSATNQIVNVEMLPAVNFCGKVITSDNKPVRDFDFFANPHGLYERWGNPGHVRKKIKTDENGYFEVANLLPAHYEFTFRTGRRKFYSTNVVLYSDEKNYIEFVLPAVKIKHVKVNGVVLYEKSKLPAEGIELIWRNNDEEITTTTDANGNFNITYPYQNNEPAFLEINEPDFAKVHYNLFKYSGEKITLLLRETSVLTGKMKTKAGEPVQGISVRLIPIKEKKQSSKNAVAENTQNTLLKCYYAKSQPTDENGTYVISNAAAPQTYLIFTSGNSVYFPQFVYRRKVKIKPGKTTVYNFTMLKKPTVFVKLKDENNKSVVKYKLYVKSDCNGWGSEGWRPVTISDENDYYSFHPSVNAAHGIITLKAKTGDGLVSEIKKFSIEAGKTYNVNLKLGEPTQPPDIAGFVYTSDEQPYIDGLISATAIGKSGQSKCDYLGYFQITGMDVDKGARVELCTSRNQIYYTTNVYGKDDNIEWILPKPVYLCGRVFIEDYTTPATNFTLQIMEKYCTSKVISKDGYFSLPIKRYAFYKDRKKLEIRVFVPDYAPVIRELDITNTKKYDFGDIFVLNAPAAITGRVIDHNYNPISAKVILLQTKDNEDKYFLNVNCNPNDGTFEFSNLPPGNYFIKANAFSDYVNSKPFDLNSGENYSLPDLIIQDTNALNIIFSFVLPDGSPAANVEINYFHKKTDEYGMIEAKIKPGTYRNWKFTKGDELYYAEKIKINKKDENIKIKLIYCPNISGTVTLDGEILDNAYLNFRTKYKFYQTQIYAGKFEIKAVPGKYTVTCRSKKVTTTVELTEGKDNEINF